MGNRIVKRYLATGSKKGRKECGHRYKNGGIANKWRKSSAATEKEVVWRVMQRLLKQDWGHANVVWDPYKNLKTVRPVNAPLLMAVILL